MLRFNFRQAEAQNNCASICRFTRMRQFWRFSVGLLFGGAVLFAPFQLQAAELDEIEQRGYLVVAVKDNLRPLGFRSPDGQLQGFEIDLARQLAEELLDQPDAVQFRAVQNQERLPALLSGEVDLVIAQLTTTSSRSRLVDFSLPYYVDGAALVTRNSDIQRLSDLAGQPVAVLAGSSTIATVRSLIPSIQLVAARSYQEAYEQLERGDAIAFAADASVLAGWVQEYPNYRLLPTLLSAEALSVAMPRGNQYGELRQRVNAALNRLWEQGWIQDRIEYWGLPEAGVLESTETPSVEDGSTEND
jgi:polar amino acid transport system substrate-binding protein